MNQALIDELIKKIKAFRKLIRGYKLSLDNRPNSIRLRGKEKEDKTMEKINFEKDVWSYDIEISLFIEALTKSEPKLEVEQFGEVKKELPF